MASVGILILAKSNPVETLKEHTQNLLKNLQVIREHYGDVIEKSIDEELKDIFWDLLEISSIYHDAGKIYPRFQYDIRKRIDVEDKEFWEKYKNMPKIPHNYISPIFLSRKYFVERFGKLAKAAYNLVVNAIAYHHEREESIPLTSDKIKSLFKDKEALITELTSRELGISVESFNYAYSKRIPPERIKEDHEYYKTYIMLKGILHRLDHSSSAYVEIELPSTSFLPEKTIYYIKNVINAQPREFQKECQKLQNKNAVIVASTGMGKTEGALIWAAGEKAFYTLPIRVSLNALFERVYEKIQFKDAGLLHSTSREFIDELVESYEVAFSIYKTSRQLSRKLIFSTIDQLFPFAFKYRGYEKILATLGYSRIILDEVQSYSPEILAVILQGLKLLSMFSSKFLIITATLPTFFLEDLQKIQDLEYREYYHDMKRHRIKIVEDTILNVERYIGEGKNTLIIVNTVKRAKELYQRLKETHHNVKLLHSLFIKKDRREKERAIINLPKNAGEIWITTQIVEASLDIDFDVLYTELSTLDSLFQRMGRCYRKRELSGNTPNIYIFTEDVSGIGYIYDGEIHKMSKSLIEELDGDVITEEEKIKLVKELYRKENLQNSKYMEKYKKAKETLDTVIDYSVEKSQAHEVMRDIKNIEVIPEKIFFENQNLFEKFQNLVEERRVARKRKSENLSDIEREFYKTLRQITDLTVSIPIYRASDFNTYRVPESYADFLRGIFISDVNYSSEEGVIYEKSQEAFMMIG